MAKKVYYKIVRLMPNVSSWCDLENNIYLSKSNKTYKRLKDDCDMKMINKGVKAGLISLEEHCEEIKDTKPRARKVPVEPKKEKDVEVKVDIEPVKFIEEEVKQEEVKKEEVDEKNSNK